MIVSTTVTIGLLVSLVFFVRMRANVDGTTLLVAWNWGLAGWLAWLLAWTADSYFQPSEGIRDQLWFAAAILLPCPFIAVLGARNPGARAWTAFVLVPLILVLGWPAATVWNGAQPRPLLLEGPSLMGFVVVAVMGAGNYFGTRFTLPALGTMGSMLLTIAPFSGIVPIEMTDEILRSIASLLLVVNCLLTAGLLAEPMPDERPGPASSTSSSADLKVAERTTTSDLVSSATSDDCHDGHYDRLWVDFRDYFGIVWAKRVMDRLNDLLARETLPVRMEIDGLRWNQSLPTTEGERSPVYVRADRSLRWLLRRFVDDAWIDRRLSSPPIE